MFTMNSVTVPVCLGIGDVLRAAEKHNGLAHDQDGCSGDLSRQGGVGLLPAIEGLREAYLCVLQLHASSCPARRLRVEAKDEKG